MADRRRDDDARDRREEPSSVPRAEPEPDWAGEIRSLRRAQGDRLKDIFASFDDEEER